MTVRVVLVWPNYKFKKFLSERYIPFIRLKKFEKYIEWDFKLLKVNVLVFEAGQSLKDKLLLTGK